MDFDEHSLRVLEFAQISEKLAERTACSLGAERARELLPTPLFAFVTERQQETAEAVRILDDHGAFPLGGIHDIRPYLVRAGIGQNLTPHELLDTASTLDGCVRLKNFLLRHAEKAPLLADRAKAISEFPQFLSDIEMSLSRSGDVLDSASPALASVRSQIRVQLKRIDEKLTAILSSSTTRGMLMETTVVLRDGRRCLPVKAEFKRAIGGIVHDQSSSGATLFIEPTVVVQANNELRQLEAVEMREIEKVLARLTAHLARNDTKVYSSVEVAAGMDLASAKAKLAYDMKAVAPVRNQKGIIKLRDARHPLINPDDCVPITVTFGETIKALLITGPNTGGKTVTLKTVGLLTLMAQSGLWIPAGSGSELAHVEQVFADIGDEQSIAQSLSTFSAHIRNIVRILKSVGRRALVLLDEVGSGTDPAEGAALARAILSDLLAHDARIIATTHYGELKEFAYSREGVENSAVEFDLETLRPTYRLLQGVPGSSNALHIAGRLGLPKRVLEAARGGLGQDAMDSAQVMVKLEEARRVADDERRRAERLAREMAELKNQYEARLRDLETLRREAKSRATAEAQDIIRKKTEKMDNIIGELRRVGKEGRKTQSARKKMKDAADEMIGGIGYEKDPLPADLSGSVPVKLKKGERVKVVSLGGAVGEILADAESREAQVQVGALRITVPFSALRTLNGAEIAPELPKPAPKRAGKSIGLDKATTMASELSLIGLRTDAALPRLDKYLDDALTAGVSQVRLVHGKGTGALRRAIWENLKDDARVQSYALAPENEGGAGATIVALQQ
ncbi:MAG: endonuclease MutS2 [Armatimonas sp.]